MAFIPTMGCRTGKALATSDTLASFSKRFQTFHLASKFLALLVMASLYNALTTIALHLPTWGPPDKSGFTKCTISLEKQKVKVTAVVSLRCRNAWQTKTAL